MDPCWYGNCCWRPLCSYVHVCGCKRARWWAELWTWLASVEEADAEHIVDVPGPQIEADDLPVPRVMKENLEAFEVPQERVIELAKSPESSGLRASATTAAAAVATTDWRIAQRMAKCSATTAATAVIQQSKSLLALAMLALLKMQSTVPRLPLQQSQSFLMLAKLSLLAGIAGPRHTPNRLKRVCC